MPLRRSAAWVVLLLGSALLVGGIVGTALAVRDDDLAGALGRLTVVALVAVGMHRAGQQLRSPG